MGFAATQPSFQLEIAELMSDHNFLRLSQLAEKPNLYRILGSTFTERWHSAFLAWLLNPEGSHGLGTFPLQRFLLTIAKDAVPPGPFPDTQWPKYLLSPDELASYAAVGELASSIVIPDERSGGREKELGRHGRVDVWIERAADVETGNGRLACIVEQKVNAPLANDQPQKYAEYLALEHARDDAFRGLCVYLAPGDKNDAADTSSEVIGDPHWYCVDYQQLHDGVLAPCLEHDGLNREMDILIRHYVENLRSTTRTGSLAMTKEERDLAQAIVERHRQTLARLAEYLANEGDDALFTALGGAKDPAEYVPLIIELSNGEAIKGKTVPEFFRAVLTRIEEDGRLEELELPYPSGRKRYLINRVPVHAMGGAFRNNGMEYVTNDGSLFMDVNFTRPNAVQVATQFLKSLGYQALP